MDALFNLFSQSGFAHITIGHWIMFIISGGLIYLAIAKEYEPLLLIPIGFGILVANLPLAEMSSNDSGIIGLIYDSGIKTELLPPIIFLGVGVLTDFRPLLGRPITFLLGAAAQVGIIIAALGAAYLFGFSYKEAATIGIIGGADGPTSIFLASKLAPHLLGPVALAAYSYMSLVPIIQPPIMRLLTTNKERAIDMPQAKRVSKTAVLIFPIFTGTAASLAIPSSAPLIGMLMFGNLIRESGVTDRLKKTAGGPMIDIVTIFLGLAVGATMEAGRFLTAQTLMILTLGAIAFVFSTMGGILFAKFINLFLAKGKKINPCIGAAGVSAVPMAARVVQNFVSAETNGRINPLMAAMGPNVAGVIGSAVAAGVFLSLLLS
jgi:sodium ion-translocating decarboxylase beta subunit